MGKREERNIWRRIALVPFNVVIPESEQDKELSSRLENELSGILNWAVKGCLEWQQSGLAIPEKVKAATDEYQLEQDSIRSFIEECLVEDDTLEIRAKELYSIYTTWCLDCGYDKKSQKLLGTRLKERGYKNKRRSDGFYWLDLGMRR